MDRRKALWDHMTCERFLGIDAAQWRCGCAHYRSIFSHPWAVLSRWSISCLQSLFTEKRSLKICLSRNLWWFLASEPETLFKLIGVSLIYFCHREPDCEQDEKAWDEGWKWGTSLSLRVLLHHLTFVQCHCRITAEVEPSEQPSERVKGIKALTRVRSRFSVGSVGTLITLQVVLSLKWQNPNWD